MILLFLERAKNISYEEFLTQLLRLTGVPVERLMMVPGNHDIDRDTEIDAFYGARCILRKRY